MALLGLFCLIICRQEPFLSQGSSPDCPPMEYSHCEDMFDGGTNENLDPSLKAQINYAQDISQINVHFVK